MMPTIPPATLPLVSQSNEDTQEVSVPLGISLLAHIFTKDKEIISALSESYSGLQLNVSFHGGARPLHLAHPRQGCLLHYGYESN